MFVIEKLVNDLHTKDEAWLKARDRWVKADDYRYEREYEERNPRPGSLLKKIGKSLVIGLLIGIMTTLFIGFIKEVKISNDNKPEVAQTEGKNCQNFNKNDHVRIQYGDFVGNNGVIIGGCESNEAYQVKIDDGSKASVGNDGMEGPVDVGGRVIGVNDSKNLIVVEIPKEKE